MKTFTATLCFFLVFSAAHAQIMYDNGPLSPDNNFVVGATWGRTNITYSFNNGTGDIAGDNERNAIRQAFQIWSDFAPLTFTEVNETADISISWAVRNHNDGAGNAFDGTNGVLAHAFLPNASNAAGLAGDVHFDDDESWTLAAQATGAQPIDLVTVAAHEIGHALGLNHSNVNCALMNPFYTGSHRYLSQDDIDGIQSAYGNRTVVRTTNLNCNGGTAFINNLPDGASVFWSSSNSSVATVANNGNQGTISRAGNASGNVRITATITLPCGANVTEFIDIHVGVQTASDIIGMDPSVYFSAEQTVVLSVNEQVPAYNWSVYGGTVIGSSTEQSITVKLDNCFNGQTSNNNFSANITLTNECGTGSLYGENTYAVCGGSTPFSLAIAPNPTSGSSEITLSEKEDKSKTKDIREIRIVDKMGNIRQQLKYGPGKQNVLLDFSNLPTDIYTISAFDGKNWINAKVSKQ